MKELILVFTLLLSPFVVDAQSNTPLFRCKDQTHIIPLSINNSGQTVEGPACAQITVNALRYAADFGKTVTSSTGPNIPSIFPSSFSAGGALLSTTAPPNLEDQFNADNREIQQLPNQLVLLESGNRTASSNLDRYLVSLRSLINQTDDVLGASGPPGVLALVNSQAATSQMDAILNSAINWKTTDEIVAKIQKLQAELNSLPLRFPNNTGTITGDPCSSTNISQLGWNDWSTKCRDVQFKLAQSTLTTLLTEANQWTSDSDKAAQFAKKMGIVQYWKNVIASLSEVSFTRQAEVRCGVLFNRNEQTVLKLIVTDRTVVFDGQTPQPQTKDGLLTVTCSSPFSISGGAAFSTIENRQFAIIKSAPASGGTTSVNKFGTTSDSRINPYPIAIAHARLRNWDENRYALHFSFGIGANVKGQDSGGSNPEFLTGLSFSFLRTIFITGGLDVGKQSQLAGGFAVGDSVPTDITSPPVSSSYKPGFGFAITFTKP